MTNIVYKKRKQRIRRKLKKVSSNRYRLTIFRSSKNITAQIVDDKNNKTLVYATSAKKDVAKKNKTETSTGIATILAKKALEKKITKVYFDRGRYKYHGRIKYFAVALRKEGLIF